MELSNKQYCMLQTNSNSKSPSNIILSSYIIKICRLETSLVRRYCSYFIWFLFNAFIYDWFSSRCCSLIQNNLISIILYYYKILTKTQLDINRWTSSHIEGHPILQALN